MCRRYEGESKGCLGIAEGLWEGEEMLPRRGEVFAGMVSFKLW